MINMITNYRTISKISFIPKMFKALFTENLSKIMSPYICNNQHALKPKTSTANNIL